MHWSLFIFFNHENGRNGIIDLFFSERFALNADISRSPDDISSGICSVQLWFLFLGIWDKLVVLSFAGIWMLFRQMRTISCATWLQLQLWTKDGEICWRIWSKSFSRSTTHTVTLSQSFWSAYMSTMTLKVLSWNCVNVRRWDLLAVVDQMLGIL
jgi:hypothetical protein